LALPVIGILTLLAFRVKNGFPTLRAKLNRALLAALVVLGLVAECGGFFSARRVESNSFQALQYLKESHAVAIVGHRDVSILHALTPLYFDKRLYYTGSEKALRRFLDSAKSFPNTSVIV
jgi:hypothetical protein